MRISNLTVTGDRRRGTPVSTPGIVANGVFPLAPDYPLEVRRDHEVVVHQFGSGNAKVEQRFLLGTGARRFTIHKQWLRDAERITLRNPNRLSTIARSMTGKSNVSSSARIDPT